MLVARDSPPRGEKSGTRGQHTTSMAGKTELLMRAARNPQGSTPLFRSAPVVRFETCAHGARMWQGKNLMENLGVERQLLLPGSRDHK